MKQPHNIRKWFSNKILTKYVAAELLPLLAILSGFIIEARHIATTAWADTFFNNSDSLTLALIHQSIRLKEPMNWILSSQIFLFPEAVIYAIASIFSTNFRVILIVNSLLICLLIYLILRFIFLQFSNNKMLARLFAVLCTMFVIMLTILETRNMANVVTPLLMTTYYYGVVLMALASISLIIGGLKALDGRATKPVSQALRLVLLVLISFLTMLSNPMFLLQFVAPLTAVAVIGWLINRLNLRQTIFILIPQYIGSLLGVLASNLFFTKLYSPSGGLGSYLHLDNIDGTLSFGKIMIKQMLSSGNQGIELVLLISISAASLFGFLWVTHMSTKTPETRHDAFGPSAYLIVSFAGLAPLMIFCGVVLTGNPTLRYLLPLCVYPLLGLAPFVRNFEFLLKFKVLKPLLISAVVLLLLTAVLSNPFNTVKAVGSYYPPDVRCMDEHLKNTPNTSGIAQFWRARGLQLNSRQGLKVIQVDGALNQFDWLYNSADYYRYSVSFVIVDHIPRTSYEPDVSDSSAFTIDGSTVRNLLGKPSEIYSCHNFDIYTYAEGTPGRMILNNRLRRQP